MLDKSLIFAVIIVLVNAIILVLSPIPNTQNFALDVFYYGILGAFIAKTYVFCLEPNQILGEWGIYLREQYDLGCKISKPLGVCAFCTAFLVGTLLGLFTHYNLGFLVIPFSLISATVSTNIINLLK